MKFRFTTGIGTLARLNGMDSMLHLDHRFCLALAVIGLTGLPSSRGNDCGLFGDFDVGAFANCCDDAGNMRGCDGSGCDSSCGTYGCNGHDSCWTRSSLTGDWLGLRYRLQQCGITYSGTTTHYGIGI